MTKVFVLGAADPEMEEIERVVRECGHEVRYATQRERRVRADNANYADGVNEVLPYPREVIFVECRVMGLPRVASLRCTARWVPSGTARSQACTVSAS